MVLARLFEVDFLLLLLFEERPWLGLLVLESVLLLLESFALPSFVLALVFLCEEVK